MTNTNIIHVFTYLAILFIVIMTLTTFVVQPVDPKKERISDTVSNMYSFLYIACSVLFGSLGIIYLFRFTPNILHIFRYLNQPQVIVGLSLILVTVSMSYMSYIFNVHKSEIQHHYFTIEHMKTYQSLFHLLVLGQIAYIMTSINSNTVQTSSDGITYILINSIITVFVLLLTGSGLWRNVTFYVTDG